MTIADALEDLLNNHIRRGEHRLKITTCLMRAAKLADAAKPLIAELESGDVGRIAATKEQFESLIIEYESAIKQLHESLEIAMDSAAVSNSF